MQETLVASDADREDGPGRAGDVVDGRYRIGEVLARGGMGIVYAAQHVTLGTRLAIKVLRPELGRDEEIVARFQREARAASALGHPHIVDVRDFGTTPDGASYFVMERLDGRDLADEVARGPLAPERVIRIALQVLDALAAAHRHGIVHRDLKPENVFLADRGADDHVKVLDFGVAKILQDDEGRTATGALAPRATSGHILGTPAYMSPEQCAGRPVDARSDLYALGIVLYELLTGSLPFDHDDPYVVMRLQRQEAPLPPSELVPGIPPALEGAILRCIEKSPDARPASAAELAIELAVLAPRRAEPSRGFSRPSDRTKEIAREPRETRSARAEPGPTAAAARVGRPRWALAVVAVAGLGVVAIAAAVALHAVATGSATAAAPPIASPPPPETGAGTAGTFGAGTAAAVATSGVVSPSEVSPAEVSPAEVVSAEVSPAGTASVAGPAAHDPSAARRPRPSAPPAAPSPPAPEPAAIERPIPESPALRPVIDPWADGADP